MRAAILHAAGQGLHIVERERPTPGVGQVLVQVRACGICGTGAAFVQMGGMLLGPEGQTTAILLGHEPASSPPCPAAQLGRSRDRR